jgi:hypothetical protein
MLVPVSRVLKRQQERWSVGQAGLQLYIGFRFHSTLPIGLPQRVGVALTSISIRTSDRGFHPLRKFRCQNWSQVCADFLLIWRMAHGNRNLATFVTRENLMQAMSLFNWLRPNQALQRTRRERCGCNPRLPWVKRQAAVFMEQLRRFSSARRWIENTTTRPTKPNEPFNP